MGILKRRSPSSTMPNASALNDPQRAVRLAAQTLASTSPCVDEMGRRTMPAATRDQLAATLSPAASAVSPSAAVPCWPSGTIRLDGRTLEFGAGETRRIDVSCLREITVKPGRGGRLSLDVRFQAGLDQIKTGVWIEASHAGDADGLVGAVRAAMNVPAEAIDHHQPSVDLR